MRRPSPRTICLSLVLIIPLIYTYCATRNLPIDVIRDSPFYATSRGPVIKDTSWYTTKEPDEVYSEIQRGRRVLKQVLQREKQSPVTISKVTGPTLYITNGTMGGLLTDGETSDKCPGLSVRCVYQTSNKQNGVWRRSHAAIFKPFYIGHNNPTWKRRPPGQTWIFDEHESPMKTWNTFRLSKVNIWDKFNASILYTRDADIQHYMYAFSCKYNPRKPAINGNYLQDKIGSVLWIVSNCDWTMGREVYVEELKKYIDVKVVGECGEYKVCGGYNKLNNSCVEDLMRQYKFYLAFENSFCDEYYTEKVRKTLYVDTIPIVMGLADYESLLGERTYIDVRDFSSVKNLADFLKRLGNDPIAYNQYIYRKARYDCQKTSPKSYMCQLCKYLEENRGIKTMLPNLKEVWGKERNCQSPDNFFRQSAPEIIPKLRKSSFFKDRWKGVRR